VFFSGFARKNLRILAKIKEEKFFFEDKFKLAKEIERLKGFIFLLQLAMENEKTLCEISLILY